MKETIRVLEDFCSIPSASHIFRTRDFENFKKHIGKAMEIIDNLNEDLSCAKGTIDYYKDILRRLEGSIPFSETASKYWQKRCSQLTTEISILRGMTEAQRGDIYELKDDETTSRISEYEKLRKMSDRCTKENLDGIIRPLLNELFETEDTYQTQEFVDIFNSFIDVLGEDIENYIKGEDEQR